MQICMAKSQDFESYVDKEFQKENDFWIQT